jgi:hypothetical protein
MLICPGKIGTNGIPHHNLNSSSDINTVIKSRRMISARRRSSIRVSYEIYIKILCNCTPLVTDVILNQRLSEIMGCQLSSLGYILKI